MRDKLTDAWLRYVVPLEAVSLFIGAALHSGLSFAGIEEPYVLPALVVESVIGSALLIGAVAYRLRVESWAGMMIGAQVLTIAGVLLGIAANTFGNGQSTLGNDIFHRVLLVTLSTGLVLTALEAGLIGRRGPAQSVH